MSLFFHKKYLDNRNNNPDTYLKCEFWLAVTVDLQRFSTEVTNENN